MREEARDVYLPWYEADPESMTELEQIKRVVDQMARQRAERDGHAG